MNIKSKSKLSRHQKFKPITVSRSKLKNAPYNPRGIDTHSRVKLKKSIEKHGLVETIVWNKRTGNVVGGHQRLAILDKLEKGKDYELVVAALDVSLADEKRINILLNNQNLAGDWDSVKLETVLDDLGSIEGTGFDTVDLQFILPDDALQGVAGMQSTVETSVVAELNDMKSVGNDVKAEAKRIADIKEKKRNYKETQQDEDRTDFWLALVFSTGKQFDAFVKQHKLESLVTDQYVDAPAFCERFKIKMPVIKAKANK